MLALMDIPELIWKYRRGYLLLGKLKLMSYDRSVPALRVVREVIGKDHLGYFSLCSPKLI